MATQVSTGRAARLTDLPVEVLGLICRRLSLSDMVCLSITCRALWHGLASSEVAWGTLEFTRFTNPGAVDVLSSLLAWLARRRQGLRHLELDFSYASHDQSSRAAAQLAGCLEGSPLVEFRLRRLTLPGQESGVEVQWLGSCMALTSLRFEACGLHCLPGALAALPSLAELRLDDEHGLGGASWQPLGQLTALTQLHISECLLAALPAELAALSALAELNLASNYTLGGASWAPLRQLTALTRLNASFCGLAALPPELAALPALAALDLYANQELGAAAEEAWAPLAQCSALTFLDLGCIMFSQLPAALAALAPCLVGLSLEYSGRHGNLWAGSEAALEPLCRLTGLTWLNLYESVMTGLPLPEGLSCLRALQDLHLSQNEVLGEQQALRPLRHLTALTRLGLNSCGLSDLPEGISHLLDLKDLDLGGNYFRPGTSWQSLHSLTALTRLIMSGCSLERLPPELAELRSLAELGLGQNKLLGGLGAESAASTSAAKWAALEQLTALTQLDATTCGLHALPTAIAALPALRMLRLADNPGLGRGGVEALQSLKQLTGLTYLDASTCELQAMPMSFAALSGLQALRLAGNCNLGRVGLEALLPLTRMTTLQQLDLSYCSVPRVLEVDAIPFPLHCLDGWAERIQGLPEREVRKLRLG